MPNLVPIAAALAALATGLTAWMVWTALDPARRKAVANLNRGRNAVAVRPGDDHRPLRQNTSAVAALARKATPSPVVKLLSRQYVLAGRPQSWSMDKILVLKMLWLPVAALLVLAVLRAQLHPLLGLLVIVMAAALYFYPEIKLNGDGVRRNETIQHELADTLDQMTIAVEAGLGFDAAMQQAARNGKGPLAEGTAPHAAGHPDRPLPEAGLRVPHPAHHRPGPAAVRPGRGAGRRLRHLDRRRAAHLAGGNAPQA